MSWNVTTNRLQKSEVDSAIDQLVVPLYGDSPNCPAVDQVKLAKIAAKELCKGVQGPYVAVQMSGHANGEGWHEKDGYANDFISVSVSQVTRPQVEN